MTAAFGALCDHDVNACVGVAHRLRGGTAQRRDQPTRSVDLLDHVGRGGAQRVGQQLHLGVRQRHLHLGAGRGLGPAEEFLHLLRVGNLGHPVRFEQFVGKLAVLFGDEVFQFLLELGGVVLAHALVLAGDHDVDAVGQVADVLVNPGEFGFQLFRGEPDGAKYAEPAGLGHGHHHVAAVGKRKDWKLDTQLLGKFGLHG